MTTILTFRNQFFEDRSFNAITTIHQILTALKMAIP